jgi:hypothetical protein
MVSSLHRLVKASMPSPLFENVLKPVYRAFRAFRRASYFREMYYGTQLRALYPLLRNTGEMSNFTYDLTDKNLRNMSEMIAVATRRDAAEIERYIEEAIEDRSLRGWFVERMRTWAGAKTPPNLRSPFGRRLGWYAVTRAIKPRVLVETGVDRGHGALVLCAALLRNAAEGRPGRYYGTDLEPKAGHLLGGEYASVGQLLIGDSIQSLRQLNETVDLFINDSDHSAAYEAEEYRVIAPKLSPHAIILGDNAHATDELARFSRETGRRFLFFREEPKAHWYPGGGIGVSFPKLGQ